MRLWSLHPQYLDSAGLNASWREGLLAKNVLLGNTKGYANHPQLIRFKNSPDPNLYIDAFLTEIYKEAVRRNFSYNKEKIRVIENIPSIPVTKGQLEYEYEHLRRKLQKRSPEFLVKLPVLTELKPHPLFETIEGEVEDWEIIT
ncbi:pyrimidine dimer DNA glycosylase/endonuclease V [Dysgonomonas termitidis]|uniref:Pyrimidine dimer DNA glycosylase/endonuclease V n=1 Tax=Dysgonomonas termitidis TaxID=1516126 RepID=A0ABV9KRK7_9BACT